MKKLLWMTLLLVGSMAYAQEDNQQQSSTSPTDASTAPAQQAVTGKKTSDKLDLKKLEGKYWSSKDSDVSVVQNRTYSKANKYYISASYGILMNDAYSYGRMSNLAVGHYFSERWGIEAAYEQGALKPSDSTDYFTSYNQFAPNYNTYQHYYSINGLFVPFYAKMSFMDRAILYFDMQFAVGIGQMSYQQQEDIGNSNHSVLGYNFDVTQNLFFSKHFALRLDLKNQWSNQDKARYSVSANPQRSLGSVLQQDTSLLLGLTYFFGL